MKTVCRDGVSVYKADDTATITLTVDNIEINDPDGGQHFIVSDMNENNVVVYDDVVLPDDWMPRRYLFDGVDWVANPNVPFPREVSMRQARIALHNIGLLTTVNDMINNGDDELAKIEWEYATSVRYNSPLVQNMKAALNLSEFDLRNLFLEARRVGE